MEGSISGRQAGAWGFCAASVPAVLTCAGLGWGWVLLGCAIAAGYYVLTQELANGAVYLPELTVCAFGNAAGRVVLAIGVVFTLLAAAQTARRAGIAFPDGTAELAGGVIVLLGTLAGEKDAKQAAKVCGVLFLVLAGLYTIILLAAAKNVQLRWMAPWGGARQTLEVVPSLLALTCLRFLPGRTQRVKRGWLGLSGDLSSSFSGGDGGVLIAAAHAAADVPVLYGEPEPQRAGGDGAAGAGCLGGAAHGIFCAGEPAFRGWAGADRVGGAEPGREEMGAGCAWDRRVRTQLSNGRNTGRSVGFGSGCMLGDRAAINTTNSGHKIICENSKKGVDKRLLL